MKHGAWSLKNDRGTEILLNDGWEGERICVNGRCVTVQFDALSAPVNVCVDHIEMANHRELHRE